VPTFREILFGPPPVVSVAAAGHDGAARTAA